MLATKNCVFGEERRRVGQWPNSLVDIPGSAYHHTMDQEGEAIPPLA